LGVKTALKNFNNKAKMNFKNKNHRNEIVEGAATPAPKGEAAHGEQAVYAPLGVGGKNGNKEFQQ
jgi:hypothetical protein